MRVDCLLSRIDFNLVLVKNKFYQRNAATPSRFVGCVGVGCWLCWSFVVGGGRGSSFRDEL